MRAWTLGAAALGALVLPACDAILGVSEPILVDASDGATVTSRPTDAGHDARDAKVPDAKADTHVVSTVSDATPDHTMVDAAHDALRDVVDSGHDVSTVDASDASTTACPTGVNAATSCAATGAGLTNCGAGKDDCCCASLEVPGGTFDRQFPNTGSNNPPAYPATVSGFRLDKYEVTVGRFRQYIAYVTSFAGEQPGPGSGKHTHLNGGRGLVNVSATPPDGGVDAGPDGGFVGYESGWQSEWNAYVPAGTSSVAAWNASLTTQCNGGASATWTSEVGNNENLPLNCIGWWDAYAFCIWDGGFLPSEAEWEYAAAGGSDQRNYAWGSESPGTGSQYAIYDCNYPLGTPGACYEAGTQNIAPVGTPTLGLGRWGQLDLGGSVFEYSLDTYGNYTDTCTDCVNMPDGLGSSSFVMTLGGSFQAQSTEVALVTPGRFYGFPTPYLGSGVRCARTP